jgi:hypothetical protein
LVVLVEDVEVPRRSLAGDRADHQRA